MPQRLTFEYNPLSYAYPDDETDKELFLQASRTHPHHPHAHHSQQQHLSHLRAAAVLLYWVNMVFNDGEEVWQVVRLDEQDNVHRYVYPDLIVVDGSVWEYNDMFSLGVFTRDQREAVLECADEIEYEVRCAEGGQGVRWMGRLLEQMVEEALVGEGVVNAIRDSVPFSLDARGCQ
ncbi:hypothetical protein JVU11DRAFT_12049 [Chiua virens]|nr:hypothetical protein JVU11DRAFT_12049 [Chiua virens]